MEESWDKLKIFLVHLAHFKKRNRIRRYGFPILLIIIVSIFKQQYHDFLGENAAFLLLTFFVTLSSWYGGLGPGVFATFLAISATFFTFLITDVTSHPFLGDLAVSAIFIIEGLVISIMSEARYEMENQKDEFIGFVSHELKNPLSTIKGFAGLIAKSAKNNGNEKILSYSEQIHIQSNNILELINDLLDVTKIEIGKFTYIDSFFRISDVVKEAVAHQQIIVKNRIIELHGKTNTLLYGDRYRIAQVVTNLLTNAVKYSPPEKKIIVTLKVFNHTVQIRVKDFGIGIPKSEQKQIFNRFYRAKDAQHKRSEGLGLGLYITNQIVLRHKGKLWVDTKPGKGSTFYVSLPLHIR